MSGLGGDEVRTDDIRDRTDNLVSAEEDRLVEHRHLDAHDVHVLEVAEAPGVGVWRGRSRSTVWLPVGRRRWR